MTNEVPSLTDPATEVLIVDDSQQYAQVLTRILGVGFGYRNITYVPSTDEGFDALSGNERFRLVFIDYNFPDGKTGGSLLTRLRDAELLQGRVVFLITSDPNVRILDEATKAGAFGVVAKPFNREELQRQLERAQHFLYAASIEYI